MMKNAILELKVWSVFMTFGVSVLATEVVVKSQRPLEINVEQNNVLSTMDAPSLAMEKNVGVALPEELVAHLLVDSVVQIESAGNPRTVGSRGERGLMQIMRATWRETTANLYGKSLSFDRAFDPAVNRKVGTAYLATLHTYLQQNRNKWQADERSLLLACYNAGPQRVAAAGFNLRRLPASTQDYVKRASALHDQYLKDHAIKLVKDGGRGVMQIVQISPDRGS